MIGELVARQVVAAAAGGLLLTGLAVLALELKRERPVPVERDTGPLASVSFVGILGFVGVGLATAIWGVGTIALHPGWIEGATRLAGLVLLALAGLLAAWGLWSIGRQMSSQAEVRPDTELVTDGARRGASSDAVNQWRRAMAEVHSEVAREAEPSSNVARAVWGLLLIWIGAAVFLRWGWGVGAVGAGAILLGAQAVRRYRRVEVDRFGLIAGALLVLCGAGSLFQVAIDLFPLLIVAAGIVLLVSAWTSRARRTPGGRPELPTPSHPRP